MKVWGVFSVENEYYQPRNNLVILYEQKPSFEQLKDLLFVGREIEELSEDELIWTVDLLRGEVSFYGTEYRLEEIEIGKPLEQFEY